MGGDRDGWNQVTCLFDTSESGSGHEGRGSLEGSVGRLWSSGRVAIANTWHTGIILHHCTCMNMCRGTMMSYEIIRVSWSKLHINHYYKKIAVVMYVHMMFIVHVSVFVSVSFCDTLSMCICAIQQGHERPEKLFNVDDPFPFRNDCHTCA